MYNSLLPEYFPAISLQPSLQPPNQAGRGWGVVLACSQAWGGPLALLFKERPSVDNQSLWLRFSALQGIESMGLDSVEKIKFKNAINKFSHVVKVIGEL